MNKIAAIIILLFSLFALSCSNRKTSYFNNKVTEQRTENIDNSTRKIDVLTTDDDIHKETTFIRDNTKEIKKDFDKIHNELSNKNKKIEEQSNKYKQAINWAISATMILGTIGIGVGVVLFFTGGLKNLTLVFICFGLIIGSLLLSFVNVNIIILGIVCAVFVTGLLIYKIFIFQRGTRKIVQTVEKSKAENIIDVEKFNKIANETQDDKATRAIVDKFQEIK